MACNKIKEGYLCTGDDWVNLEPFGAKIWMSWHNYLGPTFYRSEAAIKPIVVPGPKTWEAFGKWLKQRSPA